MFVNPFLLTEVGGLKSYGARIADAMRQGGGILKCERCRRWSSTSRPQTIQAWLASIECHSIN